MSEHNDIRTSEAWARLRFSIIGQLLAAPPKAGELCEQLRLLAERRWQHPTTGELTQFGVSTIERWYYAARNEAKDPVAVLRRRVRKDAGQPRKMIPRLCALVGAQYEEHKSWSFQLHYDNLAVLVRKEDVPLALPSYATVRRWMKAQGLLRRPKKARRQTEGMQQAEARLEQREVRSYEAEYVGGLWHLDFHHGSCQVIVPSGEWVTPILFATLDDRSRLCCHAQWYLDETAETLTHGLMQALLKRGLPRALMTDNGSAMRSAEFAGGMYALSILPEFTLPYSPYQNAKQEVFWVSVEGRLVPMLEGEQNLTLELLNEATQAWVERDYNWKVHSELGTTPMRRFLDDKSVARESPSSEALRAAFRGEATRRQRRSDGTISLAGKRFEIPSRYRTLEQVRVRYASWNLGCMHLVDARSGTALCQIYLLDKQKNAEGVRRATAPIGNTSRSEVATAPQPSGIAPLLKQMMADYSATGLPPAYLPKQNIERSEPGGQSSLAEEQQP